uniref:HTH CENPB-type domain-containing protein n=1 Tax=Hyaloperonospora arabidopsidis (strain Emoy2) TaxID=559515 RepID=M4BTI3_HYAAE
MITGDIICVKAHRLAQLLGTPDDAITFSHGWLRKFQQRHMLRAINIYGESGSVDVEAMNKALPDVKKNAIDCDERREGFSIHKVDQLTAMRWSLAAWNEISSTTIANCFSHTELFSTESVISSALEVERSKDGATEVEEEEIELEQELIAHLKKLRVRDPMKISELLDPIGEDETAQPELTDNEILKKVLEADDEEENSEDAAPVAEKFTRTEKINLLRDPCSLLDVSQESH